MPDFAKKIKDIWDGEVILNCSLAQYSTFRIGGPAEALIQPETIDGLANLIKKLNQNSIPWHLIGRGSNLVISDEGVKGVVIALAGNLAKIQFEENADTVTKKDGFVTVSVEAGCSITRFLNWCIRNGLSGLEFLAGVPGSVGGAVIMNAGAMGNEICEVLRSVTLINQEGQIISKKPSTCEFEYRKWKGACGNIVAEARMQLKRADSLKVKKLCCQNIKKRKEKQPRGASAGSVFKNPPGDFAGRLLEEAGLKGRVVGGAQISQVHANFIVNKGGATAKDVLQLIKIASEKVYTQTGVWLRPEIKIL